MSAIGGFDFPTRVHECTHEVRAKFFTQIWIGGSPQTATDDDVATVRSCDWIQVGLPP